MSADIKTPTETPLEYIFREIVGEDERGAFLKNFARAYISADEQNQYFLFTAAIELVHKYDLHTYLPPDYRPNFIISPKCDSITCLRCGSTSWHPQDVKNKYCGRCHVFHEDVRNHINLSAARRPARE